MKFFLMATTACLLSVLALGCSSFFQERVLRLDQQIAQAVDEKERERLQEERKLALEAAAMEQANKQAMLLAAIGAVSGVVKMAAKAAV